MFSSLFLLRDAHHALHDIFISEYSTMLLKNQTEIADWIPGGLPEFPDHPSHQ